MNRYKTREHLISHIQMKFLNNLFKFILVYILIISQITCQSNNCIVNKQQYPTIPPRVRMEFSCYSPTLPNPGFPQSGSNPSEYNELIVSPNMFTVFPIIDVCMYNNSYLVDLSHNLITNLTNIFQSLKCLKSLKTLIISNNLIRTPLLYSDFDDNLASNLVHLDLNSNQIAYIDPSLFTTSTGISRFTKLQFLDLSLNYLKEFDLLWPLTLPSINLVLNMSNNPISALTNNLTKRYDDSFYPYPVRSNRIVNILNNNLQTFDDTNLLQYGLLNSNDLNLFLYKIANYNFKQSDNTTKFLCTCPTVGLKTVTWYKQLLASGTIEQNSPINQLFCMNNPTVYVLNTNCYFSPSTTTTTTTIVSSTTTPQTADPGLLQTNTVTTTNYLYLLFLLIIPLVIILILIFICCLGRQINLFLHKTCDIIFCNSCRPGKNKIYDATVIYSEHDEKWVEEEFKPLMYQLEKPFKMHFYTSYHNRFPLNEPQKAILNSSKRIIIMMSKSFLKEEWEDVNLRQVLNDICAKDRECTIIIINKDQTEAGIDAVRGVLETGIEDKYICCVNMTRTLKHTTQLDDVELLNWNNDDPQDNNFVDSLEFLMPKMSQSDNEMIVTDSSGFKLEKIEKQEKKPKSVVNKKPPPAKKEKELPPISNRDDDPLISKTRGGSPSTSSSDDINRIHKLSNITDIAIEDTRLSKQRNKEKDDFDSSDSKEIIKNSHDYVPLKTKKSKKTAIDVLSTSESSLFDNSVTKLPTLNKPAKVSVQINKLSFDENIPTNMINTMTANNQLKSTKTFKIDPEPISVNETANINYDYKPSLLNRTRSTRSPTFELRSESYTNTNVTLDETNKEKKKRKKKRPVNNEIPTINLQNKDIDDMIRPLPILDNLILSLPQNYKK